MYHVIQWLPSHACLKVQAEPGVMVYTFNPSSWKAEAGGSQAQGQPRQFSETPCLKETKQLFTHLPDESDQESINTDKYIEWGEKLELA